MKEAEVTNMNVHNGENENFDSSPKSQSEMQSCKLNNSDSKPNVTLKKIGQELDLAETKCLTLKSELNYMMGVCREAEIKGSKGAFDVSHEQAVSSSKDPSRKSSAEHHDCNSEITDIFQLISPIAAQISLAKCARNDDDDDGAERAEENLKEEKQQRLLNVRITPRSQLEDKLPPAITTMPVQSKNAAACRAYKNLLSCCPEHLRSVLSAGRSIEEELTSRTAENYFRAMSSSARGDIAEISELDLDVSDGRKTARTEKDNSRALSRAQRNEASSTCKTGDAVSKTRKRKGKLRSFASKSTIATKDTSLVGRREIKRRRHRGHGVTRQQSVLLKHPKRPNDVVEIFHNTTLKSSNSRVSSKHFKFDRERKNSIEAEKFDTKYAESRHLTGNDNQKRREAREKSHSERVDHESRSYNPTEHQQNHRLQTLDRQNNNSGEIPDRTQEQNKSEKHPNDSPLQCKTIRQCEHTVSSRYNDPMLTPNYEMPTLSSKLKRSNRSYFSRFNFRNIPFVVGTSVTPSYNLGLNIQQVLSVMKTKQPITNDIAPLLIRKVSKGVKPVSNLMQRINELSEKSIFDLNSKVTGLFNNNKESLSVLSPDKRLFALDLQRAEEAQGVPVPNFGNVTVFSDEDRHKIKQRSSSAANKSNAPTNARDWQGISGVSSNKEDNVGDHKSHIAGSRSSKEIRDVLINLHDQFEEMNTKYEKLQLEAEKSSDKALAKELSTLEKELNVKEEEINAVVGLYKEVMTLKQQMKTLHERNSLVCIATESSARSSADKSAFPMSIIPARSHLTSATQIVGRRRRNARCATREPPTSIQLAALLRQIQSFHKQLQLV